MNEPAVFVAKGDRSLPKVTRHCMEGRGGEHREAHNQGEYAFPYDRVQLHLHGVELKQAWVDDVEVTSQGNVVECNRFGKAVLDVI